MLDGRQYAIGLDLFYGCNIDCGSVSKRRHDCLSSAVWDVTYPRSLTLASAKKQLGAVRELGFSRIVCSGSEITLWPHLPEFIGHTRETGLDMIILTNGTTLTPEKIAELGDLTRIVVSVDRTHDEAIGRTNNGLLGHAEALANLAKTGQYGKRVIINTVISESEYEDLTSKGEKSYIALLADQLAKYDSMIMRWNIWPKYNSQNSPTVPHFESVASRAGSCCRQHGVSFSVRNRFPGFNGNTHWIYVRTDDTVHDLEYVHNMRTRIRQLGCLDNQPGLKEVLVEQGFLPDDT